MEATVVFGDIRSFTSISERLTPREVFQFINSLMGTFGPIIRKYEGFIDKFMGDALLAIFPSGKETALKAALEISASVADYNRSNSTADREDLNETVLCNENVRGERERENERYYYQYIIVTYD